jgi:hypothetical protein
MSRMTFHFAAYTATDRATKYALPWTGANAEPLQGARHCATITPTGRGDITLINIQVASPALECGCSSKRCILRPGWTVEWRLTSLCPQRRTLRGDPHLQ